MRCFIETNEIDISMVGVDAHGFGRDPNSICTLSYVVIIGFAEVIAAFGEYYDDFIDREKEDEGFEEVLNGDYLTLKTTGYLDFKNMLRQQPKLLARIIHINLPTEFMGYIFYDRKVAKLSQKYTLQTLENVTIENEEITCTGRAFINPKYVT